MSIRRFITDHPVGGSQAVISGDELHHLRAVNRARSGDIIEVLDGNGALYTGEIRKLSGSEALVDISEVTTQPRPPIHFIIAPSLTKKKNMSVMVEKLSQLGVGEIRPIICSRTDEAFSPSMLKKWRRITLQALKVTKQLWATQISEPITLERLVENTTTIPSRLLFDFDGTPGLPAGLAEPVLSVVGPPGGFTPEEIRQLTAAGFVKYKINDGILKTETAAIAITAIAMNYRVTQAGMTAVH